MDVCAHRGAWLRSLVLFWMLALAQSWAVAQELEFHPPLTVGDPSTPNVMRDLAARILPVYQEGNTERYLANLSALQLVAGNYAAAWEARRSLRDRRRAADARRPAGKAVIYNIYTHAKAIEAADHVPFSQAFDRAYREVVPKLGDRDAFAVTGWLEAPESEFQDALQKAFDERRAKGAVALPDALDLIEAYVSFEAYRSFGPLVAALDAEDSRRRYLTEDDIQIEASGGVVLSARLVRPKDESKPLPALLEFTLATDSPSYARECAARGYVGVIAYARGRLRSTAESVPFQHDGEDVRAVIDWIAKQPWSDGRVGMYGTNYSGFAQWAAAKRLPPALKAIATYAASAPGVDIPMSGSIFRNAALRWVTSATEVKPNDTKAAADDTQWRSLDQAWYTSGKPYRELGHVYGKPNKIFTRWLNHPSYDLFWQKMIPYRTEFAHVGIPVLTMAGYYGDGEVGALYYYTQHYRYDAHANQTLLIGPYDDGVMQHGAAATLRGVPIDAAAVVDLRELRYRWFDSVLKGAAKPDLLRSRVNFEVMGANEWRHVSSIEAMSRGAPRFYLDARVSGDGHLLAPRRTSAATFVRQSVSLADRGDAAWTPASSLVGKDLQSHNGVTYISAPVRRAAELSGLFSGRLDFTVNKQDVDLNMTLYELLPNGDYVQLFDPRYEFRASYARDRGHRHLLKAGERQQLTFRSERLTSRKLQEGSRIVVVLGVNKRPDEQINYGSGNDVSVESVADEGKVPIRIRWYSDSYVDLPIRR